jgi:flagellar motor switch protein FliM
MSEEELAAQEGEVRKLDLATREHFSPNANAAMEAVAAAFARSARRSLPFLTRFKGKILPRPVEMAPRDVPAQGFEDLPSFTVNLAGAGNAWATLTLTSQAIAMVLEGSLGGRGAPTPGVLGADLTAPQRALIGRIARSLAGDLAAAIGQVAHLEVQVTAEEPRKEGAGKALTGFRVVCDVDGTGVPTALVITIGAKTFDDAVRESTAREAAEVDPRIGDALPEVDLELVAELGRVSLGLRRVLSLKPGDVIRLTTAVDDAVAVRIEGAMKFFAAPITSRGQLAVEIRARHGK